MVAQPSQFAYRVGGLELIPMSDICFLITRFEMALGAVEISINTTLHVYQPLSADFLSISDPVDVTSLKSVQMPVVHATVKVGNF